MDRFLSQFDIEPVHVVRSVEAPSTLVVLDGQDPQEVAEGAANLLRRAIARQRAESANDSQLHP